MLLKKVKFLIMKMAEKRIRTRKRRRKKEKKEEK
jgi:hypothetical protein